jgi:hypothetical protein
MPAAPADVEVASLFTDFSQPRKTKSGFVIRSTVLLMRGPAKTIVNRELPDSDREGAMFKG